MLLPVPIHPGAPDPDITALLAIDPGNEESGWVLLRGGRLERMGITPNPELLAQLDDINADHMAIEMVDYYGMTVSYTVFDTARWVGKFEERWGRPLTLVYRKRIGYHFCNSPRAKDSSINAVLKDRFGGKGTKNAPGFLFGVKEDIWAAVAVAVYWVDCTTMGESMAR
jgi:hypothetical protein